MLQITGAAQDAMRQMRSQSEAPEEAAIRIQLMSAGEQQGLGLAFTSGPEQDDAQVADEDDLKVYVSPDLVEPLSDAVIDAQATDQGTQLLVREQETPSA